MKSGGYGSRDRGNRLLAVKINPRDVVAIPTDYNNSKGRACQYHILKELDWDSGLPIDTVGFRKFDDAAATSVPATNHAAVTSASDAIIAADVVNAGSFTRKWTDAQVLNAKALLKAGADSLGEISRNTGMSRRLLARIRDGEAYADVK